MIAKLVKGKGFRGALEYDLREQKGRLLDTNMASDTPRELAREFGEIRALRPNLNTAVCHISLSIAPDERLTDDQWREIAHKTLSGMGFKDSQYVVTKHEDTKHPHIHLLANRVDTNGRVVTDSHDYKRLEGIMRSLEKEYGLREVAPSHEAQRRAPTKDEIECAVRTGKPSTKVLLQEFVDKALKHGPEYRDFVNSLEKNGVEVMPNVASTGRVSGISFRHNDLTMKGSALGKGYSWGGLQKRGLQYEQSRDAPAIGRERDRAAANGDIGRNDESDRHYSRGKSQKRRGISEITRTLIERHAQNHLRNGASLGSLEPEQQIHQNPARGGYKNMELLSGENRGASGQDTEHSNADGERGSRDSRQHGGIGEASKDHRQTPDLGALGLSSGNGGTGISALDRIRAMADAGHRYTHPQPERNLRITKEGGGEDSSAGREEVIQRGKGRKKEVDMER